MSASGRSSFKEDRKNKKSFAKCTKQSGKNSFRNKNSEKYSEDDHDQEMEGMYGYKNTRWVPTKSKEDEKDESDYDDVNPYQVDELPPLRRPTEEHVVKFVSVYKPDNSEELAEYLQFVKAFMEEQYMVNGPILVGASGFEERALHLLRQCEDSPCKYELAKMHILFPSLMIENEEKVKKMSSSEIKSIVDSAIKDLSHK